MANPFRAKVRAMLASVFERLASDARFTPAEGAPIVCKAMPESEDTVALNDIFPARALQSGHRIALLRESVAERPVKGDMIELIGDDDLVESTWRVTEDALSIDSFTLIWICAVVASAPVP